VKYKIDFEDKWLECLKNSFYDSLYFDSLVKIKPRYENHSVELVAFISDELVGLLDIEIVPPDEQICRSREDFCGQIALVAVIPDKRRLKIGTKLLESAIEILGKETRIKEIEILFREDGVTSSWLTSLNFDKCAKYYEVSLVSDFFAKYEIKLPFGLIPNRFDAFLEKESFDSITKEHSPEQTYPISVFQKGL
jgi:ribosomal protein S18 acetylase RimI-like enzyme